MTAPPQVVVVMGVSGCGKSTVAALLAARLGWDLAEGDELHSPANVAKMASGRPLTDDDRLPWLRSVAAWIQEHLAAGRPGVITCSALKRRYRDLLRDERVAFVLLDGSTEQLAVRLAARHGHYMPPQLLDSQLADLERPGEDERAIVVGLAPPPAEQAGEIARRLGLG